MIAYLAGYLAVKEPTHLIIECAGVGYMVKISLHTYDAVRSLTEAKVHTYHQIKEDGQTLFGFYDPAERLLFEQLISVNGVGGGTALLVLSSMRPGELVASIQRQDVAALKRIKGIGQKTAERIVLELKDKLTGGVATSSHSAGPPAREEALQALVSLGFVRNQVEKKVDDALRADPTATAEALIKAVLRSSN